MSEFILSLEPEYIRDLAAIWLESPDPAGVSQAGNTVDKLLKSYPAENGQYLSEGMYQLIVPPLAVYYTIDADARIVSITSALPTRTRT